MGNQWLQSSRIESFIWLQSNEIQKVHTVAAYSSEVDLELAGTKLQQLFNLLGHLVYDISSGCYLYEVCPSKSFKFEKVEDSPVRNFMTFIFSVNAKKSYKKAVK